MPLWESRRLHMPEGCGVWRNSRSSIVHYLRSFLLIFLVAALAACESYTPVIESNKDPAYGQRLTRVLVATNFASLLKTTSINSANVQKAIADKWSAYGVAVSGVDLEDPAGRTSALANAAASFKPQQILEISATSAAKQSSIVTSASFNCSLYDVASKKRIWRAAITTRGDGFHIKPTAASEFIDVLTNKLRADGLL
jgi:hypothetical protein